MALPKKNRLPLRFERSRINKEGHPVSGRHLTVIFAPSNSESPRFAILVSKKINSLAVKRNLLRRRVAEAIYPLISRIAKKDYLIIPKKSSENCSSEELKKDISTIFNVKTTL